MLPIRTATDASCSATAASPRSSRRRIATDDQRAIRIVNTGIVGADAKNLKRWVAQLKANNAQGELYLTDVFAQAAAENAAALAVPCDDAVEGFGANDAWQLAHLERHFQLRIARELCARGLRLADPARFDVRGHVADRQRCIDRCRCGDRRRRVARRRRQHRAVYAHPRLRRSRRARGARALRSGGRRHARRVHDRSVRAAASGNGTGGKRARRQFRRGEERDDRRKARKPITSPISAMRRSART